MMQVQDGALCLLCKKVVGVLKEYNIKRHFETLHSDYPLPVTDEGRSELYNTKKNTTINLSHDIKLHLNRNEIITLASFEIANLILK